MLCNNPPAHSIKISAKSDDSQAMTKGREPYMQAIL